MRKISTWFPILTNKEQASDVKMIGILAEIDTIILKLVIAKEDLVVRDISKFVKASLYKFREIKYITE